MTNARIRIALLAAAIALTGCGDEDGPVAPRAGGDQGCTGGPQPGVVSLWTECLRPSVGVDFGCESSTVPVILTNDTDEDVYVWRPCGPIADEVTQQRPDGSWEHDGICPVGDCFAPGQPWLLLPPGGVYEYDVGVGSHAPHVVSTRVGLGCPDWDPVIGTDPNLCDATLDLVTPIFVPMP